MDNLKTKKTIIFDLDETLVFATKESLGYNATFEVLDFQIYVRPHLEELLKFCQQHFEIAVWTSSGKIYAEKVVQKIFPSYVDLAFVWTSEKCTTRHNFETREYYQIKNLQKLKRKGYQLENLLIVDDTPEKCEKNYGNHIPIKAFQGEAEDDYLFILEYYLKKLTEISNYRAIEKRYWYYHTKRNLS